MKRWKLWLEINTGAGVMIPVTDTFNFPRQLFSCLEILPLEGLYAPEAAETLIGIAPRSFLTSEPFQSLLQACIEHPRAVLCVD